MTTVLVACATKMGATREIADAIGDVLRDHHLEVTIADVDDVGDVDRYDAVVIGSALYMARWRSSAMKLLGRVARRAGDTPCWLFQSGPLEMVAVGSTAGTPKKVAELARRLGTSDPTTFGGRIEPATARGFLARRMAAGEKAGDYRNFDEIRSWATGIADALTTNPPLRTTVREPQ